jgi:hypothetical protein
MILSQFSSVSLSLLSGGSEPPSYVSDILPTEVHQNLGSIQCFARESESQTAHSTLPGASGFSNWCSTTEPSPPKTQFSVGLCISVRFKPVVLRVFESVLPNDPKNGYVNAPRPDTKGQPSDTLVGVARNVASVKYRKPIPATTLSTDGRSLDPRNRSH